MISRLHFRTAMGCVLMAAFAVAPMADWVLPNNNTLEHYPHWQSTTILREQNVNHAQDFITGPQTLAGNQLNLHAWHGYQEVILNDPLPREADISLRFKINAFSWLAIGYNHDPESFDGFVISGRIPQRACVVSSVEDGRFAYQRQEASLLVSPDTWHTARICLDPDSATLWLNGERAASLSVSPDEVSHLGLRGGLNEVVVDNLIIRDKAGEVQFRESFSQASKVWFRRLAAGLLAGVVASLLLILVPRFKTVTFPSLKRVSISLFLCGLVLWAGTLVLLPRTQYLYPELRPNQEYKEADFVGNHAQMIADEAAESFEREKPATVYRVLLLGTSQIWGSGALYEENLIDAVIADRLKRQRVAGKRFEVLNGAIPGAGVERLHHEYKETWAAYAPDFVIVNLGLNDSNNPTFETGLTALIQDIMANGHEVIVCAEPITVEWLERLRSHRILAKVAAKMKVPFIDLHGRVASKHHSGFLWLDYVHATSYGQRIIAEFLVAELCNRLNCQAEAVPRIPDGPLPQ